MEINKTVEYKFTKEEVQDILIAHVADLTGDRSNEGCTGRVDWKIIEGDRGIKDPMDYSPYQPTSVKTVTVTI